VDAVTLEIDSAARIKSDSFGLEQEPLQLMRIGSASQADLATRVDDAMPRHTTS